MTPPDDERFRARARAWLDEHAPPVRERLGAVRNDRERFDACRSWQRILADGGWAGLTWPREHGGAGLTPVQASIFGEEQARAGVTAGFIASTVGMVGPVLLRHASAGQRDRYLRPLLRGEETWCQLFSEPGAGSDLANLATRARRDGDEFVVDGEKVWTSNAHLCDFAILLARTDPDAPKHRGITFFLVDLHSPGIDVRPLRQITGAAHFNEVFLTGVRIPAANVVGTVDGGWGPARTVLAHEAAVIGGGTAHAASASLIELARTIGRHEEPLVRQALARAYTRETIQDYLKASVQAAVRAGRRPTIDGSVLKVLWAESRRDRARLAVDLLGVAGTLDDTHSRLFLDTLGGCIGGGTNEVHRTMIGERVLALPPEARVDKDVPYRELTRT
jgi:alkylation response protein AidB-like acyl-CoA dehydrogenase